jgi:hydrogenase expression/formation protein HypD
LKHIREYRDPSLVKKLATALNSMVQQTDARLRFMEVCGTHTMAVAQYGLKQLFPSNLELISGPGCPVCVTPVAEVDRMVELAMRPGVRIASFGDMLKVPGSGLSLAKAKAAGARINLVYSPAEALELAEKNPEEQVVFLAVGFETTSPAVAATVLMARTRAVGNFTILCGHKLLPPALLSLISPGDMPIDGFLLPGHVSAVIGARAYASLPDEYGLACVVGGFEPADILGSLLMMAGQCVSQSYEVQVQYARGVGFRGNARALEALNQVFEPADSLWRGLGMIPKSGLALRPEYREFDAARRFGLNPASRLQDTSPAGCRCGDILKGLIRPRECPLFEKSCTPQNPAGPCMVSSEGACAAYYRYERKP